MKKWLEKIASDIEAKYGTEVRNRIFGEIQDTFEDDESEQKWFNQFTCGMDELNDKDFLTDVMASNCPCSHIGIEENIRKNYAESKTLEEFAARLDQDGLFDDNITLDGNILIATKRPFEKHGKHNHMGPYTTKCHCQLGSHAQQPISNIFCHCCTVGFYGKMFRNALGQEVKVEFRDSVISGGKQCTAAIYLSEKNI